MNIDKKCISMAVVRNTTAETQTGSLPQPLTLNPEGLAK
jgi:hypothetical protein